ncbi:MAG TPA: PaaI family thioesterase [Kofleriaceae bacterium]|nr:PaaI family thioesterase [Kofleriaceae bacterium]
MSSLSDADAVAYLNQHKGGWNRAMELNFLTATADEVVAEVVVGEQHLQPYGIVHGGVHCGIIEAACSTGAAMYALPRGQSVVGLENATSFVHAARGGTLRVTARPLTRGRRSQAWEARVTDESGRLLATGKVRLLCLEPDSDLAGKKPGM